MIGAIRKRVLLVEDDDVLRGNYEQLLVRHGLSVEACGTPISARDAFDREKFDVAVLDVTLGDNYEAGFDLCQEFRAKRKELPIIFLTERDGISDRISGLRLGADDYLSKTTSSIYLVARITALIRRTEALRSMHVEAIQLNSDSNLSLDEGLSKAYWKSVPLELSLTQYWILRDLARNPGQVRSTNDLMKAANIAVQPNTIVVHIKAIRDIVLQIDSEFECIKNERSRGYRWVEGLSPQYQVQRQGSIIK